jgi:hypothetical protein
LEIATWKDAKLWPLPLLASGRKDPAEHPIARALRAEGIVRLALLAATLTVGAIAGTSQGATAVIAASFGVLSYSRHRLHRCLVRLVQAVPAELPLADEAPGQGAREPVIGVRADARIRKMRRAAAQRVRRLKRVASTAAFVTMIAAALSGIAFGEGRVTGKWQRPPRPGIAHHPHRRTTGSGDGAPASGGSPGRGASLARGPEAPSRSCSPLPFKRDSLRGVTQAINQLFEGRHQLGPRATGCPRRINSHMTPDGELYYAIGVDGSERPRSIALVSPKFPRAIVLDPAEAEALSLIEAGEDVGGSRRFPRYYARSLGAFYLLRTSRGTVAVVQQAASSGADAQYVPLPVSAAYAWLSAIREAGKWEVPLAPEEDGGETVYRLISEDGQQKFRITYDHASGTAIRNSLTGTLEQYAASEPQIAARELAAWRLPVPGDERRFEAVEEPQPEEEGDQ